MTEEQTLFRRLYSWFHYLGDLAILVAAGCLIGAVVAVFEAMFVYGLNFVSRFRAAYGGNLWLLILPGAGLLIVWLFSRFGRKSRQGMALVFRINQGVERWIPKRTISLMAFSTWLSHLAGASVGKEGVGMQIGATVSHVIGRNISLFSKERSVFLITGMAAGFAGLFGTPMTAVFFAMEVLVSGILEFRALASSMAAAFCAAGVGAWLGVGKEAFAMPSFMPFDPLFHGWRLVILGLIFGVTGAFFAWMMHQGHTFFETRFPNPYWRIGAGSVALGLLLWVCMDGRYSGSGASLIQAAMEGAPVYGWDWILKLGLSVLSLSMGFIGGEVTPLFAIGATLGFVVGPFFGLDPSFGAALGYAAVFGAGTNTWLAPMMIGMEIFGYSHFPFFFIVCSAAYLVNGNLSIYTLQRKVEAAYDPVDSSLPSSSLSLQLIPDETTPAAGREVRAAEAGPEGKDEPETVSKPPESCQKDASTAASS